MSRRDLCTPFLSLQGRSPLLKASSTPHRNRVALYMNFRHQRRRLFNPKQLRRRGLRLKPTAASSHNKTSHGVDFSLFIQGYGSSFDYKEVSDLRANRVGGEIAVGVTRVAASAATALVFAVQHSVGRHHAARQRVFHLYVFVGVGARRDATYGRCATHSRAATHSSADAHYQAAAHIRRGRSRE